MVLEKTLESSLECKEISQSILKGFSPEYSLEGLMLKFQYFGHLMQRTDSLEKTLMLGQSPGKENGYPLQYSGLDNSMDCTVHRVGKSQTQLFVGSDAGKDRRQEKGTIKN